MIGRMLAHYQITSAIGAGGMGEVYRATDTKLGRDVALKVLPAEMAADPERLDRFQREARALAALDHPGIVSVFSVEESDGVHFLTMQLVEGESLDHLIPEGGFPLDQLLEIAVPLSDALAAAHEKSIVHRDLKPANVIVAERGRVKVLDFGLAKLAAPKSEEVFGSQLPTEMHTREGVVMGTVPYMSPEQVSGKAVDHRTDIFSLGIILYEMASGRRPFQGSSSAELISSILRDTPPAVTQLRVDLPRDLARIIRRCLEKDTRERLQSARDLHNELKGLRGEIAAAAASGAALSLPGRERPVPSSGSHPARPEAPWIAVLPLKGQAADAELEAFADGLAEDITTGLSRFRYLSVVARASTARLKGQAGDVRTLAAELGARYVLEGSVRKAGSAIRVSARLIDAHTGTQLWAGTYDRDLQASGIFDVQDDVAARIVATVADSYGVLVRSMTAMIQQKADEDLAPSEWLFQYFDYRQQLSPPAHTAMKDRLEKAVERDAGQADLWACLAQVYTDEYAFGFRTDVTSLDRALAAARRAVELDRANQLGMVSLAQAYFFRRD
ncbi:MAG: serine/threonine protein kinase, partial [Thermoanaerobaculia bacterium]